jgi:hypothetical protein
MDFLFNSNIMHGGDGFGNNLQGLLFALLYGGVMYCLWYVYFIKFENRYGFARDSESGGNDLAYKIGAIGIIAVIAILIFLGGWLRPDPHAKVQVVQQTDQDGGGHPIWRKLSKWLITPLAWLSTGFLAALVVSKTTLEDIAELQQYNITKNTPKPQ